MSFLPALTDRADEPELMDSGAVSPAELDHALDFLSATNAFLGGWAVMRERLEVWSRAWDKKKIVTMLDVGTGAADLPLRILSWGRRRRFNIKIIGIDTDAKVLELARARTEGEESLGLMHMDLGTFAALGGRFDYVTGSLFLHHLPPAELVPSLRLCDGLAVKGLLFSDLRRCRAAYAGVSALTCMAGRVSRFDGPLSVRRAFLPEELERAAADAGLGYLRVRPGPFFRLSLAGEKH
ncbi:MAG: methyltransferase domain-containing protein [Elusimicrobia bacterium]|nr:methyltransferase domain-containing protein [Elusimicrobiota bacterium]